MSDVMKRMPAVALRGATILPGMMVHFDISRKKSLRAIERSMLDDQKIFLVAQKDSSVENPTQYDISAIGTICRIRQVIKLPKGLCRILAEGLERAEMISLNDDPGYLEAEIAVLDTTEMDTLMPAAEEAMLQTLRDTFRQYARESRQISQDVVNSIMELKTLEKTVSQICIQVQFSLEKKQQLLETIPLTDRFELLCVIMSNDIEVMRIRNELQAQIKEKIDKNQREYILREQMKLIQEELGEDTIQSEIKNFEEKTEELQAPEEIKEKLREQIKRLKSIVGNPSESSVVRGYIETLLGLPWDKMSEDNKDLKKARKILEEDHYGLEKVKERILEYLAVRTLTRKGESPIICLVGPPGTGKTSIGRSVARALDKTYVRISLGGVRDEAEIRGHRKTYIGAMPGRIAQGLHQAGVKNPLMLLDEIDKVSSDYKGDTSSALLEVLDSEQNCRFIDHYVEVPIDLSEVLFIATANDMSTIPRPLLDRMEIIEISSYTENEKLHIAKEHLLPKQMKINGIKKKQLSVSGKAIQEVIAGYTREAGVRSLERMLGRICRKTALKIQENEEQKVSVSVKNLEDFLGRRRFDVTKANRTPQVGIVRGLAWTSVGGDTLQIEVNSMPGKGELRLTGQLGDVMKESAQAGISYIRSIAAKYGIADEFFQKNDLHVHIPEGAVPKDGPSAGITMATAILSAAAGIPVRADVAMTGEITLRGRVLPIGGLKEKLLAAKKAGITTVLVPAKNRPDVEEMEAEITGGLEICYVKKMSEVLEKAFAEKVFPEKAAAEKTASASAE